MTRICDDLVRKGLVRRRPSTEDRRRVVLELTKKGVTLIEKLLPQVWSGVSATTSALSKTEKDTLERLLKKLLFAFEANHKNEK
jgi:DNA-binding MarR family transcriptional regulator